MKFNALVVAAMVITSVNAGGRKGFPGCFGRRCGLRSAVKHVPLKNEPGLKPVEPQKSEDDDFVTPAFDLSGYDLDSMFPHGIPEDGWNVTINPDPKKDPICNPILEQLSTIRINGLKLNGAFGRMLPTVFNIMTEENDEEESDKEESVKGKGHKEDPKAEKIRRFLKSNPESLSTLERIRNRYTELQDAYGTTWEILVRSECPTEKLQHWTPETMIKDEYFFDWSFDFEIDLIDLNEQ
ncbi:hypothetical protein BASA62_006399 [Batrachochytrium salamandrivorans]|nr:hypothetical protein BASA62_006399 [Batrachochytrium salamandrivorans]